MAEITLRGNVIHTCGMLPAVGSQAPDFVLTRTDLADVSLKDFAGKKIVLNIFPSIDTPVCAAAVRKFNAEAGTARQTRWCSACQLTCRLRSSAFAARKGWSR